MENIIDIRIKRDTSTILDKCKLVNLLCLPFYKMGSKWERKLTNIILYNYINHQGHRQYELTEYCLCVSREFVFYKRLDLYDMSSHYLR